MAMTTEKPTRVYIQIRDGKNPRKTRCLTVYGVDPEEARRVILKLFGNRLKRRKAG
jgi:hypothetical protein